MRKFTSILMLLLFTICTGASAQTWTEKVIKEVGDYIFSLDEIEDGAYYAVYSNGRSGYWTEAQEPTATGYRTIPTHGIYMIASVDGQRAISAFQIIKNGDGTVSFKTASGRYFGQIVMSTTLESVEALASAGKYEVSVDETEGNFHFKIGNVEINGNPDNVVGWTSGDGANGKYKIYPVTLGDRSAADILDEYVRKYEYDETVWPVGTEGGFYPEDKVMAYQDAYDEAVNAQYDTELYTDEQLIQIANALEAAYFDCLNSLIQVEVTPGYYYLINARDTTANAFIEPDKVDDVDAAYADGAGALWSIHFSPVQGAEANPAYVWKVEAATDTTYTIKNYGYNAYLGSIKNASSKYPIVANVEDAGKFKIGTSRAVAGGFVFITNNDYNNVNNSLHAATSGKQVVNWTAASGASAWKLIAVTQETVDAIASKCDELQNQYAQKLLNDTLSHYYSLAKAAQSAGKSWISDATEDGAFPVGEGLLTDASQLFSNAKESAANEGTYEGLIDGDYTSFFHSSWGHYEANFTNDGDPHYLQIDLNEPVQTLVIKYAERSNAQTPDIPYNVTVYATNDANLLSAYGADPANDAPTLVPSSEWTKIDDIVLTWNLTPLDSEGNEVSVSAKRTAEPILKGAGMASIEMPQAYQYIRLAVTRNLQDAANNSNNRKYDGRTYWNLSELRVYKAEYDPDCVYAHMDATAISNLENSIAQAETEIAAEKATQGTIDALKAAYEAFMAVFPDKSKLNEAIADAESWINSAVEGTEPGYFNSGSIQTYQDAVDIAKNTAQGTLTFEAYNNAMENLKNAFEAFDHEFILPADGVYSIISATGSSAATTPKDAYLYSQSTSTNKDKYAGIRWGFKETDREMNARSMWKLTNTGFHEVTLQNVDNGLYMGNDQTNLSGYVYMQAEPANIKLRYARAEGCFNLVFGENLFGNAQPENGGSGSFVVWNSAKGEDNSAFRLEATDFQSTSVFAIKGTGANIFTMPYEVDTNNDMVTLYQVAGINKADGVVVLDEISAQSVPAGTPFIVAPFDESMTETNMYFTATSVDDITYVMDNAKAVNGLHGTFVSDTVTSSCLIWVGDSLVAAETATQKAIAPNTGYFVFDELPELTETPAGAVTLPVSKAVLTGIANVVGDAAEAKKAGIYTIQGVRLQNSKNLPKGVYIINGRKVVKK